ncbi:hypothetical protein [Halalkalibaculum sp. DA384]|uniref:hypothetical protein n=1 Tax=Halalkalibaculum sp. DA384 TaxID=3373606 RepID=UPI003754ABBD
MQQPTEDVRIIDLEPIGGGKVSEEKFQNAVETIFGAVKSLGKDTAEARPDTSTTPTAEQDPLAGIPWERIKRYGLYTGGTITAIYLIGKALE